MNESKVITKSKATNESAAWLFVILAGLLEIVWASGFKYEEVPSLVVLAAILALKGPQKKITWSII